ncbi:MAG: hypothetical protein ACTSWX_15345 [Promethearchaeota archaeon]
MIFLTNTCFWLHSFELFTNKIIDIRPNFNDFKWGITSEIRKELINFENEGFLNFDNIDIIPVSNDEILRFQKKYPTISHFDLADQTLIIVALREPSVILTDDGGLLMESQALQIKTFFLPQFLLILVKEGTIPKNTYYKCLRYWEKTNSYPKKQLKIWKTKLQIIN